MQYVFFRIRQVAPTDATVLIIGETGTGNGLVAHAIHEMNERKNQPMITVNCVCLPANLIDSELFGREKGAFTGAHAKQTGRFEIANGGTIFLVFFSSRRRHTRYIGDWSSDVCSSD